MTRQKTRLEFIVKDNARKATFKKRKKGLRKKIAELSTLCGIDACSVLFSPYEPQLDVWPSVIGAQQVFSRFRQLPAIEQTKKMVNQVDITQQRIAKATELLRKKQVDNREKKATEDVDRFLLTGAGIEGLSLLDLMDIQSILDQDLQGLKKMIETMNPKEVYDNQQLLIPHTVVVPRLMPENQPPLGTSMGYCEPRTQCLAAPPLAPLPLGVVLPKMEPPPIETYTDNGGPRTQWAYNSNTNPTHLNSNFGNGLDDMDLPFPNTAK